MIVKHISDTHGSFPLLKGLFDVVVHSGDFFPDNDSFKSDVEFQKKWLLSKISKIKGQIKDKPFLFTLGNHDFLDPNILESILRTNDIDAHSLENKVVSINDFKFYGFPYVPYINGSWNYERKSDSMRKECIKLIKNIKGKGIDVLVAHAPLHGILDKSFNSKKHLGNNILLNYFIYKVLAEDLPKWYLHGHIHENNGISCEHILHISNAATTQHNIEIH